MTAKRKRRRGKKRSQRWAAKNAPVWVHVVAAGIRPTPKEMDEYRTKLMGSFGPASEVRKIDPANWHLKPKGGSDGETPGS